MTYLSFMKSIYCTITQSLNEEKRQKISVSTFQWNSGFILFVRVLGHLAEHKITGSYRTNGVAKS